MKYCPKCGSPAAEDEVFCGSCGTALPAGTAGQPEQPQQYTYQQQPDQPQQYTYQQPNQQQQYQQQYQYQQPNQQQQNAYGAYNQPAIERARTKREFLQTDGSKYASSCVGAAVLCYISAGVTLIVLVFAMKSYSSLLDVGLLLGLGLGIHLRQNIPCAIILLVFSIINILVMLVTSGTFGGWLLLIAGIIATVNTTKAHNAWKEYQNNTAFYEANPQAYQQMQAKQYSYSQPIHQDKQEPKGDSEPSADEWKCPKCGKINKNYVGTCGCGEEKPR